MFYNNVKSSNPLTLKSDESLGSFPPILNCAYTFIQNNIYLFLEINL